MLNYVKLLFKKEPMMETELNSKSGGLSKSLEKAALLAAMSNLKRLEILHLLSEREASVGELAERVGLSQSALSQHLAKLRWAGLVTTKRNAQSISYFCSSQTVRRILDLLSAMYPASPVSASVALRAAGY